MNRYSILLIFLFSFLVSPQVVGQSYPNPRKDATAHVQKLPSLREQAKEQQEWLERRLDTVLPILMSEYDVDMWILSMREYAEDPVFWSITSATTFAARRRSIYVFHRQDDGSVKRLALGGSSQGGVFEAYKDPDQSVAGRELWGGSQWDLLHGLVKRSDPKNIVLNIDGVNAFADGLHAGEREELEKALGPELLKKVVRVPELAVDYIAVRLPEMLPRYQKIQESVHAMISEAFSSSVIEPGVTRINDVRWWLREKVQSLGMTTWFHPSVSIQRQGGLSDDSNPVILRGDLLWCDFGVVAMRLKTDTQHLAYVLKEGETEAPEGLTRGLAQSNRLQDILLAEMSPGRSGNEILLAALSQMESEGINGTIYTHPIGDHGHGAGPLIGLWDRQEAIPGRGDIKIRKNTWHSIELQSKLRVPEWDEQLVEFRQEEEAYLDENGDRHWVYRRQERLHLVW